MFVLDVDHFLFWTVILPLNAEFLFYLERQKLLAHFLGFSAILLVVVAYPVAAVAPPFSSGKPIIAG